MLFFIKIIWASWGIRTHDPLITNQLLWPTELRRQFWRSQRDSNPYLAPWQGGIVAIQPWDRNCQSFLTVTPNPQVLTRIIVSLVGSVGKVTATSVSKPILWLTAKCSSTDYSHIPHLRLWWVDIHSFPNSKPIASYRIKVNHILGGQDGVLAFFPTTSSVKLFEASAIPFISNGTKTTEYLLLIERETRFELATYSLEGYSSTNWATPAICR